MWEFKKISIFLSTGHGILPSCGCKARETIANLFFEEPRQLTKLIRLNHVWQRTYPFKALIAIFWDL